MKTKVQTIQIGWVTEMTKSCWDERWKGRGGGWGVKLRKIYKNNDKENLMTTWVRDWENKWRAAMIARERITKTNLRRKAREPVAGGKMWARLWLGLDGSCRAEVTHHPREWECVRGRERMGGVSSLLCVLGSVCVCVRAHIKPSCCLGPVTLNNR